MTAVPVPPDPSALGRLASVHRYPVKSMAGEVLDHATVDERRLHGDRVWCVRDPDGKLGSGKSSRRFRKMDGLLSLAAHYDGDTPVIRFTDGRTCRGDDPEIHGLLSAYVGRPVTLSREEVVSHFDEGPIHLLTMATVQRLAEVRGDGVDVRRLRPNLVLETRDDPGFVEDGWLGRQVAVGSEVVLAIRAPMPRCVMVNLPQLGLPADPRLLQTAEQANGAAVGVVADVLRPGAIAVGDPVAYAD
jgi:uncharacterized protein